MNSTDEDRELALALKLSEKSYEEEIRRRGFSDQTASSSNDLIVWEDVNERLRRNQITNIKRLYNADASKSLRNATVGSSRVVFMNLNASPSYAFPSSSNHGNIHQNNEKNCIRTHCAFSPASSSRVSNNSSHLASQNDSFTPTSYVNIPFRPNALLPNGDLIDLNESNKGDDITYQQLCEEFDPLWQVNLSSSNDAKREIKRLKSTEDSLPDSHNKQTNSLERSQSVTSTHLKGRPPPPKPPRQSKSVRSGSIDSKRVSLSYPSAQMNDLHLKVCNSEINGEIESLIKRVSSENRQVASYFVTPVVDYLIVNCSSVKVVVEKDFSWPSEIKQTRMTFTCATETTIGDILANAISTFLEGEDTNSQSTHLPIEEYGVKLSGLDEFLVNSCKLGTIPSVCHDLAFGNDVKLEVGKLRIEEMYRENKKLDCLDLIDHNTLMPTSKESLVEPSKEDLDEIINALKNELRSCEDAFQVQNGSRKRRGVKQTLKLFAIVFGNIMPLELTNALDIYMQAENTDQLLSASHKLITSLHMLILAYCNSTSSNFCILPLKEVFPEEERKNRAVYDVEELLVIHIDSLFNIPERWLQYFDSYCIAVHVMHGTAELCKGFKGSGQEVIEEHTFTLCRYETYAAFDIPLCVLPRESRVLILVYGIYRVRSYESGQTEESEGTRLIEKQLAYASFPLFSHEGLFRQGPLLLPLTPFDGYVVQPWGARPIFNACSKSITVLVSTPQFRYNIVFPSVDYGDQSRKEAFGSLSVDVQQDLLDIMENSVAYNLSIDEKELLWEKRHYLVHSPVALSLVLASAVAWDYASLTGIYQLIDDWAELSPMHAIELLLPHFPDVYIRDKAVHWLRNASSDFLFNLLPQFVEILRFEAFENSPLAVFLLKFSTSNRRFAFELYWQLQQRIDHTQNQAYSNRCLILQKELLKIYDENFLFDLENQKCLLKALHLISLSMKDISDSTQMLSVLRRHLSLLDANILENRVRLPILPSFLCTGIDVQESNYFNSLTKPMKVVFKGIKTSFGVLYKVGDDMRQDTIVLQLVKLMNDIWLSNGLNLRMVIFRCMPVGQKIGMVELVPNCRTLCEIQKISGATGVFRDDVLKNWLQMQNPNEFDYQAAMNNFQLSCAGWCVATYVLGVGDRHNDNILVTTKGHVFHIDFGKYMGDWQMAAGFRRDRVPFIFTSDMACVINNGSSQSATIGYQSFVDNCCKAFNLLRKNFTLLTVLLKMVSCSDIPGMGMEAVNFVQDKLLLNLTDTQATVQFTRMIEESLKSKFPRLNFFAHTLVQLKSTPSVILSGYDDPNKLSFSPQLYNERDEGRIISVQVLTFEKWHIPDKVYMYMLEVTRAGHNLSSYVYRSFAEFCELYVKLCRRFPIFSIPPISRSTAVGRSNIRSVADRRRIDIQRFILLLLGSCEEVAHCDLVYTFFHMIYRDSFPEDSKNSKEGINFSLQTKVTGTVFLRITYHNRTSTLNIFVGHVKGLCPSNKQIPDSYVKTYLQPDINRMTKRKTRIIKNTQMPTFNEELIYSSVKESTLTKKTLEVSVWKSGSLVGENTMIGSVNIALNCFNKVQFDRKGVKTVDGWFDLNGNLSI